MGLQPARSHSLGEPGNVSVFQERRQEWEFRPKNRSQAICGCHACDHWLSWPQALGLKEVGTELARSVWEVLKKL